MLDARRVRKETRARRKIHGAAVRELGVRRRAGAALFGEVGHGDLETRADGEVGRKERALARKGAERALQQEPSAMGTPRAAGARRQSARRVRRKQRRMRTTKAPEESCTAGELEQGARRGQDATAKQSSQQLGSKHAATSTKG